jgi:hypothetical protein
LITKTRQRLGLGEELRSNSDAWKFISLAASTNHLTKTRLANFSQSDFESAIYGNREFLSPDNRDFLSRSVASITPVLEVGETCLKQSLDYALELFGRTKRASESKMDSNAIYNRFPFQLNSNHSAGRERCPNSRRISL